MHYLIYPASFLGAAYTYHSGVDKSAEHGRTPVTAAAAAGVNGSGHQKRTDDVHVDAARVADDFTDGDQKGARPRQRARRR